MERDKEKEGKDVEMFVFLSRWFVLAVSRVIRRSRSIRVYLKRLHAIRISRLFRAHERERELKGGREGERGREREGERQREAEVPGELNSFAIHGVVTKTNHSSAFYDRCWRSWSVA